MLLDVVFRCRVYLEYGNLSTDAEDTCLYGSNDCQEGI